MLAVKEAGGSEILGDSEEIEEDTHSNTVVCTGIQSLNPGDV